MAKKMLIDATHPEETRVVVLDGQKIEDFDFESTSKRQIAGNIYLAKVTRVEPSLQAAFVEYGGNRHGFLAFSEIHPDYYQIPKADRDALLAEEEAEARRLAEAAEARRGADIAEDDDEDAPDEGSAEAAPEGEDEEPGPDDAAPEGAVAGDPDPTPEAPSTMPGEDVAAAAGEIETPPAEPAPDAPPADDAASAAQDDAASEDGDARPPREMTESAGTEEDERVSETWRADRAKSETDADGGPTSDETPAPAATSAPAANDQAPAAEAEADATEDEEAPLADAAAPETPAPDAHATDEAASGAADGDDVAGDAPAEATWTDPETGETEPGEAEAGEPEGGAGDEDAEGEDGAGRRRRLSRRGGRSRSRRRSRKDGEEAAPEAPAASAGTPAAADSTGEPDDADLPAPPEGVERDAGDFMAEAISARRIAQRRYKIQEVIKVRQIMLVQVVKEERGNKGAALTTYLSLAGRYCVLMPNTARGGGISRKITNAADRKKLKDIAGDLEVPRGMGLIVRTAGAKRTKAEIKRDYEYLLRQWERIRGTTLTSVAPTLIYEEGSLIKRVIRDLYTRDIDEILVEGEQGFREAHDYMSMLMPPHARHVKPWREPAPLYTRFGVEQELDSLFNPTVQLKSGGYIVIGVTEALVAIDINSGKSTKEGSIEDTALKTNLEAADEIARQLKLRDLAGLVVIDFIDMEDARNNRAVEKRMKDRLKDDRARIQTGKISAFGLMEMSRQRLRPGMIEATTAPCGHCHGTGVVRSDASLALAVLRKLQSEAAKGRAPELKTRVPLGAAGWLFNEKREHLAEVESRFQISIRVEADPALVSPQFEVERVKTPTRTPAPPPAAPEPVWTPAEPEAEDAEAFAEPEAAPAEDAAAAPAPPTEVAGRTEGDDAGRAEGDDEGGKGRRRSRRGGRRRRKGGEGDAPSSETQGEADGLSVVDPEGEGDPRADSPAAEADASSAAWSVPAADADATATAEIPAPKRTRRRRRRRGDASEDGAPSSDAVAEEAAADPSGPATAAAAASTSDDSRDAGAIGPGAATDAATPTETAATDTAEPTEAAEPGATTVTADEASFEAVTNSAEDETAPIPEAPADSSSPSKGETDAPAPEPPAATDAKAKAKARPKRRGWWSLG